MASRPYFNHGGQDLLAAFEAGRDDPHALEALRAELARRKTPQMRDLRVQVDQALAAIKKALADQPPRRSSVSRPHQPELPLAPDSFLGPDTPAVSSKGKTKRREQSDPAEAVRIDDIEESIRRNVGSIRPCGAIPGVPSRRTFPDKRDFEIDVGTHATRVEKFVAALRALVKDMRRRGSGMRTVTLEHGEAVALDGRERGYRFPYDGDAELFEGAKVTIAIGNRNCDGRIVSVSSQWLVVSFDEDLGPRIATCVLRIDNTAMIEALADRLDKVRSGEAKLNLSLADDVLDNREEQKASPDRKARSKTDQLLNVQQNKFVDHAIENAVTYLWGPPGTGKTRSLSTLNEILFDSNKRVLICSNTNQAVDQVLINLCKTLSTNHPALEDGRVLRIGKADGIPPEYNEFVTLDGIVRRKSVDLQQRKKLLEQEVQRLRLSTEDAQRVLADFNKLDESERKINDLANRREALKQAVSDAEIAERDASMAVTRLERDLSERLAAGVMRRLLMRSEATIRTDLTTARSQKGEAGTRLRSHRLALEDSEKLAIEQEAVARHRGLTAALRDQDRVAAKRLVEQAEEKLSPAIREISDINSKLEEIEKLVVAEARIIGATAEHPSVS